jgi:hypothetical protein
MIHFINVFFDRLEILIHRLNNKKKGFKIAFIIILGLLILSLIILQ